MDFEERYVTATPEGVAIELPLAGIASRVGAYVIDTVLIGGALLAVLLVVALVAAALHSTAAVDYGSAGAAIVALVAQLGGYFVFCEVLGGGRSVGKRALGLRVVDMTGGPVGLNRSLVRNLLRLVDALPGTYAVGLVAVFFTRHNQRLGDLAAGTLVVRERTRPPVPPVAGAWGPGAWSGGWGGRALGWDVSSVTAEEIAVVRQFLVRRADLPPAARHALAVDLARRLWPKVAGQPAGLDPERFLEQLTVEKLAPR